MGGTAGRNIAHDAVWNGYHRRQSPPGGAPLVVKRLCRFEWNGADMDQGTYGPGMFAASVGALKDHVRQALASDTSAGVVGEAWSFSNVIGNAALQIELGSARSFAGDSSHPVTPLAGTGLTGCAPVHEDERHADCDAAPLGYVCGGTTIRELADWAESGGMMIATCGDMLTPTIAGAIATGSHGSRLGYGPIDAMVRGLHIVVSPDRSIWLEPASAPTLADGTAREFADAVVRDDGLFNAALVSVGAMGIVNGVVIELRARKGFSPWRAISTLDGEDLATWSGIVAERAWDRLAGFFGLTPTGATAYYQVSFDPFLPTRTFHKIYFEEAEPPIKSDPNVGIQTYDAVPVLLNALQLQTTALGPADGPSTFPEAYAQLFKSTVDPAGQPGIAVPTDWSKLYGDTGSGGPGYLYNAGFVIDHNDFARALAVLREVGEQFASAPFFIFTFRFVTASRAHLSHIPFENSIAIELDGIGEHAPLPFAPEAADICDRVAREIQSRFAQANPPIPFRMHWGKRAGLSARTIADDFGDKLTQWQAAREALLPEPNGWSSNERAREAELV